MALKEKQQRVYDWLNDVLRFPVFAEGYKGAAILINQRPAGYVTFVAHAGRDLMNRLAPAFLGIKAKRVQYVQLTDKIMKVWQDECRCSDELLSDVPEEGHLIPFEACKQISILIDEHKAGRERAADTGGRFLSTFLGYSDKDRIPDNFSSEWKEAKKFFLKWAHLAEQTFDAETEKDLVKHFNCLDGYLYIAASSQYDRLMDLNEVLDATNQ